MKSLKYEVGIKTRLKYEVGIKSRLRNKMRKLEYGTKNEIVFLDFGRNCV